MLTDKQITEKIESLVGCRFTEKGINSKLEQLFGCEVLVVEYDREECVKLDLPNLDNQLICEVKNDKLNLSFDLDLYYLKDNGNKFYITEVGFNRF